MFSILSFGCRVPAPGQGGFFNVQVREHSNKVMPPSRDFLVSRSLENGNFHRSKESENSTLQVRLISSGNDSQGNANEMLGLASGF